MMLIIVGAGASYDSIASLPLTAQDELEGRLPLTDSLFDTRRLFLEVQKQLPLVMQIAGQLHLGRRGRSVEEVLNGYVEEIPHYPQRMSQLAAVRFYIQTVIAQSEQKWFWDNPRATNLMALLDGIEAARRERERPIIVTFNYDRLIEAALSNLGQSFRVLHDYVPGDGYKVIKLHGSVNWARGLGPLDAQRFGGTIWDTAGQICSHIRSLPDPGPIEMLPDYRGKGPTSHVSGTRLALPAIAVPVASKSTFECPEKHLAVLKEALPRVRTVLTIGWRGGEHHFFEELLRPYLPKQVQGICVAGSATDAQLTAATLQGVTGLYDQFEAYPGGFSQFLGSDAIDRLLRITWQ